MADSAVAFLLQNLSQVLANEAKLLRGVEDRIRALHSELRMIGVFLKTSEAKKSKKKIEEEAVGQIRDVAHEAEDIIDTFIVNAATYKSKNMLGRMLHGVDHAKRLHEVAEKIDSIKSTINEIHSNKIKYDFQQSESTAREDEERVRSLHKRRRNVEQNDVVGFFHDSQVLIRRLVEGDSRRDVISIVGMGGLGKTTLARKIYNSSEVKDYFHCRAWIYVSNDCRARELLLGLLKQCLMPNPGYESRIKKVKKAKQIDKPRDLSSLSDDELKDRVRDYLKGIRYLLVLDDIWKTQDWDEVQDAFPDNDKGSKILITSRLKEVALHTSKDPPYYLPFLSDKESWELFSKKVFWGKECPPDLEHLGKQIVECCHGLPLSIVVLAGLLANKEKLHSEWSKVVGHVNWYLTQDETQVNDIVLKLSYDNLPGRLKPCFLYIGIFPKDFEIPVRQLLERWVAEGFIQQIGNRSPEDVAEDYLYELIDRSLIQVARVKTSGGVKTCRIHDLLRDLCISECKKDKVLEVWMDTNSLIPAKPRRLSIHCSIPHYVSSSNNDHSSVRSLFCFDPACQSFTSAEWEWLFKGFKLVRVLDLGRTSCIKIPSDLGVFIHLRYLRIELGYTMTIPATIFTLRNLQTLDLTERWQNDRLISFPSGMWKLKQLRHLYLSGVNLPHGHRSKSDDNEVMCNLQTVSSIAFNRQAASLIENGRFPKLRKLVLQISSNRECQLPKLLESLQQLNHLSKLKILLEKDYCPSQGQIVEIETRFGCKPQELLQSLQPLSHLNALEITNALELLTCAGAFPPHITKLTLAGINCMNDDGMNALGNLTKLRILKLSAVLGESLCIYDLNCVAGWFPQLQVFHMRKLTVQNWKLAHGAMPCLQSLVIDQCHWLDDLPNELWSLTTLRKVHIVQPSKALALTLRNLEIRDGCELTIV